MTGRNPFACLAILAALGAALIFGTATAAASDCLVGDVDYCSESISVTKTGPQYVNAGDQATYTINVYNTTGFEALDGLVVSDDKCSPLSGPTGDTNDDGKLDQDETWTYTCTYTPAGDPGDLVQNTAT